MLKCILIPEHDIIDWHTFKCICGKTFRDNYNLLRHVNSQRKTKPFKCNECKFKTSNSSNLNRHVKSIHAKH